MISRAASTDLSIKITRIGRTSANSVAAMAWASGPKLLVALAQPGRRGMLGTDWSASVHVSTPNKTIDKVRS